VTRAQSADWAILAMAFAVAPIAALAPNGLALLLAVVGIAVAAFEPARLRLAQVPLVPKAAVATLLGWALISCLWAIDAAEALGGLARVVPAAFLGLVVLDKCLALDEGTRARIERALLMGFWLALVLLAVEMASQAAFGLYDSLYARLIGPIAATESFLNRPKTVLALLLPLTAFIAARRRGGWAAFATVALCAPVFAFGESMAAALTLPTAALAAAFGRFGGKRAPLLLAALIGGAVLAAPLLPHAAALEKLGERRDVTVSIFHRAVIWGFVADRIAEKPTFGWGMHASRNMPDGHFKITEMAETIPLHPHNAPLQIWLELGAVGAIAAALLLAWLARKTSGPPQQQAVLVATLVTAVMIASLSYGIWQGWWFATLWLLAALTAATSRESLGRQAAS
jgi:exopolysaccharide production protein ExoQ